MALGTTPEEARFVRIVQDGGIRTEQLSPGKLMNGARCRTSHSADGPQKEGQLASDVESDDSRIGSACAKGKCAFLRVTVNTWPRRCGVSVGREDCEKIERRRVEECPAGKRS